MVKSPVIRLGSIAILAGILAGCQVSGPTFGGFNGQPSTPQPVQPRGIEGAWIGTDGVGISNFNNGVYTVVAADTGNRLAEGTYTYSNPTLVAISFRSLLRGTQINANCQLVAQSQLNCTTSTGAQLVLRRHTATITPPPMAAPTVQQPALVGPA